MSVRKILDSERWKRRRPGRLKAFAPMATNPALELTVNKTLRQSNERASTTASPTVRASRSSVTTVSKKNLGCARSNLWSVFISPIIPASTSMRPTWPCWPRSIQHRRQRCDR